MNNRIISTKNLFLAGLVFVVAAVLSIVLYSASPRVAFAQTNESVLINQSKNNPTIINIAYNLRSDTSFTLVRAENSKDVASNRYAEKLESYDLKISTPTSSIIQFQAVKPGYYYLIGSYPSPSKSAGIISSVIVTSKEIKDNTTPVAPPAPANPGASTTTNNGGASNASVCSTANPVPCSKAQCARNGGQWGKVSSLAGDNGCTPDPAGCNGTNAQNCKDEASCEASYNLYQAGLCHQTNPTTSGSPGNSSASSVSGSCKNSGAFFGLVPWYQYLNMKTQPDGTCEVASFNALGNNGKSSDILLIVLAIIDDLIRIAGMVAVVFVIVAGFKIMTAQGEPEKVASGRKTLIFALVGLAIAILAVAAVSFIGKALGS